ncbi:MAG: hypothetical protein CMH64_03150 [Nanoarchaeota archaeon]|nr:hypothetical protein [Nanoarchaeota archaeon]
MLEDEFGDIIKKARRGLNISLNELEEESKISKKDLEKMESYELKPDEGQIKKLSKILKLNFIKLKRITLENWEPSKQDLGNVIKIENDYHGYNVNSYLVVEDDEVVAIDTGANPETIKKKVNELGKELKAVLLTHRHADHSEGVGDLDCKIIMNLREDEEISIDKFSIKIFATPGHTAGSNSFLIDNFLFVGDEIFAGSIGNSEIKYDKHLETIKEKIFSLGDDIVILPGHGPITSVKEEKENNPFF